MASATTGVSLLPDDVVDAAEAIRARLLRAAQQQQQQFQQQQQMQQFQQQQQQLAQAHAQLQLQQQQQQQQQQQSGHPLLGADTGQALLNAQSFDQSGHLRLMPTATLKQPSPPPHDQRRTSEQLLMAAISLDYEEASTTTRAPPARLANRPTTTALAPRTLPKRKRAGQHRDYENAVDGADYDDDDNDAVPNDVTATAATTDRPGAPAPRRRGRPRRDAIKDEDEEYRDEHGNDNDNDDNDDAARRYRAAPPIAMASSTTSIPSAAGATARMLTGDMGLLPPGLGGVGGVSVIGGGVGGGGGGATAVGGVLIDVKNDDVAQGVRQMLTQLMPSLYTGVLGTSPQQVNFRLVKQPNELQRKSYANENRYVHPAPITVEYCGAQTPLLGGVVGVRLAKETCEMTAELQMSLIGERVRPLDETGRAGFQLKLQKTSLGNKLRLIFEITYFVGKTCYTESVVSRAFRVDSNKPKSLPANDGHILALMPASGASHAETEVWIKGTGFAPGKRIVVLFDGRVATVIDMCPNLITVLAPARPDLTETKTVEVVVASQTAKATSAIAGKLVFTYCGR
jgi:hypothetical protein